ncbi:hypothetical protein SAMN05443287_101599 [Micromonospora phaseoli]|uniref:Uncharacterized protein n=1 Tax=Micromonospora phaseoli TaxID=1144548 RepID=A0A1H6SL14_9ACTN|nr:hypothetical protein [Micromonospora phaseoli]PZW03848.1 hypothetical protein CLV64_101599 [Micromonospora phaseoli]GIJ81070.1 hypothetical protein Xph01_55020 [Micromonospora phaseoli]SEI64232.1 hypothetical protein SAMN05443287_101599 [Micromonospora phaseoli]
MSAKDRQDRGPENVAPWGTTDGFDADPPWGADEHSPMNEGSEETAVSEGRRGERRAGDAAAGDAANRPAGRHGFGSVEPTRTPAAGPGAPPDPAPSRRSFPDDEAGGDLPDNALEEATGMRPEGTWHG